MVYGKNLKIHGSQSSQPWAALDSERILPPPPLPGLAPASCRLSGSSCFDTLMLSDSSAWSMQIGTGNGAVSPDAVM